MVRVWACLNSQHSNWKISQYYNDKYPNLNQYISVFYEWNFKFSAFISFAFFKKMEIPKRATFSIIQMIWTWHNSMELTLIHFSIWQNQKWWCSGYVLTWRLRQIKVSNLTQTVWPEPFGSIPEPDHSSIYFDEINYSVNLIWDTALQRKMF